MIDTDANLRGKTPKGGRLVSGAAKKGKVGTKFVMLDADGTQLITRTVAIREV